MRGFKLSWAWREDGNELKPQAPRLCYNSTGFERWAVHLEFTYLEQAPALGDADRQRCLEIEQTQPSSRQTLRAGPGSYGCEIPRAVAGEQVRDSDDQDAYDSEGGHPSLGVDDMDDTTTSDPHSSDDAGYSSGEDDNSQAVDNFERGLVEQGRFLGDSDDLEFWHDDDSAYHGDMIWSYGRNTSDAHY